MNVVPPQNIQQNIADLLREYDHLSLPSSPPVPNFSLPSMRTDDIEHEFLKEHCKVITDKIDKQMESTPDYEGKYCAMYSHFVSLLYQHKKLEREFVLLRTLCNRYEKQETKPTGNSNTKETLEGLCRELHKQNQQLKADYLLQEKNEAQKREAMQAKHDSEMENMRKTIEKQTKLIQKQNEEKEILKNQVNNLQEQLTTREKQIGEKLKEKAIETRLLQTKASHQVKISQKQVLNISETFQEKLKQTAEKEKNMQNKLNEYTARLEKFQDTVAKSNEIFATFKQEMEKMTKTIARLEKDRSFLQAKCEQTDITLIEMVEERNTQKRELETMKTKNNRLGALCRVLQAERRKEEESHSKKLSVSSSDGAGE